MEFDSCTFKWLVYPEWLLNRSSQKNLSRQILLNNCIQIISIIKPRKNTNNPCVEF